MKNLVFCLNATLPIFFTMLLGYAFRRIGLLDESFIKKINRFVFRAALPLLLLEDLWEADFQTLWDGKFVGFCAAITIVGGLLSVLCSRLVKDAKIRGSSHRQLSGAIRHFLASHLSAIFTENPIWHP